MAGAGYPNYRNQVEQRSIDAHRNYIDARMASARETTDPEERSRCLADAVAANGMLLRGMEVGFVTGEPNYKAIQGISDGIQRSKAFRDLMADGGAERLAASGSVDALVQELQSADRALAEPEQDRRVIDVIRAVQVKARARAAQPQDYARLVAAHRLSAQKDGERVEGAAHRDMQQRIDGKQLSEETERVLQDPDFRYLMEHEKPESLCVNALRANGLALELYPKRAEQLRAREPELAKAEQPAREQEPQVPQR